MTADRRRTFRLPIILVATMAVGVVGFGVATAPPVDAAGLRNCVDVAGPAAGRAGCWELVWANGVQYRMTFSNTLFKGSTPGDLDPFYVVAPQTAAPQGLPPAFPHDHVVRGIPAQNHGTYSVHMQGFYVLRRTRKPALRLVGLGRVRVGSWPSHRAGRATRPWADPVCVRAAGPVGGEDRGLRVAQLGGDARISAAVGIAGPIQTPAGLPPAGSSVNAASRRSSAI